MDTTFGTILSYRMLLNAVKGKPTGGKITPPPPPPTPRLSCELQNFTFKESFYINVILKQNEIKIF